MATIRSLIFTFTLDKEEIVVRTRTRLVITLFVMLLVLILTPALASTEYNVSSMSAEELAALQAMIDARN